MPAPLPREELERAVRAAFGAATRLVAAEPLAGDASSRRYVRLRLAGADAPPTAVAMLLGADRFGRGSDEMGADTGPAELPFVNVARYLAARGFAVPTIYRDAAASDGMLLLEDIGDTTLWAAASAQPADAPRFFATAIELLATLQVAAVRHPDPGCHAFQRRFDGVLARWEIEHFLEHGIETRRGAPLPADERAALLGALEPLAEVFETAEPVLAHRDFMAWNLHVQDGRLRLIDFQDALLGPDAYDLAALLTDRATGTLVTPGIEADLIRYFRQARAAAGVPVVGDLDARYRTCALHRALKVIGRFYYLEVVLGKPGYLAYLPGVYAVARRMLDALPAYDDVRARLIVHVPELGWSPV